jgi:hypothetical protein
MTEIDGGRGARAVRVVVAAWCRVRVYGLSWGRQGSRGATLATGGRQGRGAGSKMAACRTEDEEGGAWRRRRQRRRESPVAGARREEEEGVGLHAPRSRDRGFLY